MTYRTNEVQLTARTVVFKVIGPLGFVCQMRSVEAAENFANLLNSKGVATLKDWRAQPWGVQLAFISASAQAEPRLPS